MKRKDWRCRLGFHRYTKIRPVNPKHKMDFWFECTRCRRFKDSMDGTEIAAVM